MQWLFENNRCLAGRVYCHRAKWDNARASNCLKGQHTIGVHQRQMFGHRSVSTVGWDLSRFMLSFWALNSFVTFSLTDLYLLENLNKLLNWVFAWEQRNNLGIFVYVHKDILYFATLHCTLHFYFCTVKTFLFSHAGQNFLLFTNIFYIYYLVWWIKAPKPYTRQNKTRSFLSWQMAEMICGQHLLSCSETVTCTAV